MRGPETVWSVEDFLARSRLAAVARPFYGHDDPGHDWSHVERVSRLCYRIGSDLNADLGVLLPAAVLHDVVNCRKNDPGRLDASERAAVVARSLLSESGYAESEASHICTIIVEHSYSLGLRPSSLEAAVLQDSDRLDALGAIGVLRAATCGARIGASYYDSTDPFARGRSLDDSRYTLDHFFTKLLDLPGSLNTDPARCEGLRRVVIMRDFLHELGVEIDAEYAAWDPRPNSWVRATPPVLTNLEGGNYAGDRRLRSRQST
jgi:uncharacterized protein